MTRLNAELEKACLGAKMRSILLRCPLTKRLIIYALPLPAVIASGQSAFETNFIGQNFVQLVLPDILPGKNLTLNIDAGHIHWTDNITYRISDNGKRHETSLKNLDQAISKQSPAERAANLLNAYEMTLKEVQGVLEGARKANVSGSLIEGSDSSLAPSTFLQTRTTTTEVPRVGSHGPFCLSVVLIGRFTLVGGLFTAGTFCGLCAATDYFSRGTAEGLSLGVPTNVLALISIFFSIEALLLAFIPVLRIWAQRQVALDRSSLLALYMLNSPLLQLATRTAAMITRVPQSQWGQRLNGLAAPDLELANSRQVLDAFTDPRRPGWETLAASRWARAQQTVAASPAGAQEMVRLDPGNNVRPQRASDLPVKE